MSNFVNARPVLLAAAALVPLALASPASAVSGSGLHAVSAKASAVVKVHDRWRDDDDEEYRHYRRHHRDGEVVDAPFTHVEAGRRVIVDAPFAHVAVGRYGRHIRAPFVDLWVPR